MSKETKKPVSKKEVKAAAIRKLDTMKQTDNNMKKVGGIVKL